MVIDREKQLVSFSGEESIKQLVIDKLKSMGYPEKGSVAGLAAGIGLLRSKHTQRLGRPLPVLRLGVDLEELVEKW